MTNEPVNSGMTAELNKQIRLARCVAKRLQWVFLLALGSLPLSAFAACPDLSAFYQAEEADSAALQQQISQLLAQCLESPAWEKVLQDYYKWSCNKQRRDRG